MTVDCMPIPYCTTTSSDSKVAALAGQAPTPTCTDTCPSHNNSFCSDGGLGSAVPGYSNCPLGSDTIDCGCRNGTTVADWLPPLDLMREYGWGDRLANAPMISGVSSSSCGPSLIGTNVALLSILCALCIMCKELAAIRRPMYVRCKRRDGRTGEAKVREDFWFRRDLLDLCSSRGSLEADDIKVRWDDGRQAPFFQWVSADDYRFIGDYDLCRGGDRDLYKCRDGWAAIFETLSFEEHVASTWWQSTGSSTWWRVHIGAAP